MHALLRQSNLLRTVSFGLPGARYPACKCLKRRFTSGTNNSTTSDAFPSGRVVFSRSPGVYESRWPFFAFALLLWAPCPEDWRDGLTWTSATVQDRIRRISPETDLSYAQYLTSHVQSLPELDCGVMVTNFMSHIPLLERLHWSFIMRTLVRIGIIYLAVRFAIRRHFRVQTLTFLGGPGNQKAAPGYLHARCNWHAHGGGHMLNLQEVLLVGRDVPTAGKVRLLAPPNFIEGALTLVMEGAEIDGKRLQPMEGYAALIESLGFVPIKSTVRVGGDFSARSKYGSTVRFIPLD